MAIGKVFEMQGKAIIPKDDCYIILPIKNMFDKFPEEHLKLCAYVHYMNSMKAADNPYADIPLDERSDQIVSDMGIEADVEDPIVKRALGCVEDLYFTTFYGMYQGLKAALDRIGKGLKTVEIDFNARDGNISNITRLAEKYETLSKSFKTAYKDYDEESGNVKVRGNSRLAIDENEEDD